MYACASARAAAAADGQLVNELEQRAERVCRLNASVKRKETGRVGAVVNDFCELIAVEFSRLH